MKAAPFGYVRPASLEAALAAKAAGGPDSRFLAGGQSLVPALNMRLDQPVQLIDLNRIAALRGITVADGRVRIGALTRHAEIETAPEIARHLPLLREAARHVAHVAIRSRGTFGGSIALADPAAEWPACALALEAVIGLHGPDGAREVPAAAFFRALYETARAEEELITHVTFPAMPEDARAVVLELARRHGDYAITGLVAARLPPRGVRLVLFGVGDTPLRLPRVEEALAATGPLADRIAAAQATLDGVAMRADLTTTAATKRRLSAALLGRAARQLWE